MVNYTGLYYYTIDYVCTGLWLCSWFKRQLHAVRTVNCTVILLCIIIPIVLQHAFRFEELKSSVLKYNLLFEKLLVKVSTQTVTLAYICHFIRVYTSDTSACMYWGNSLSISLYLLDQVKYMRKAFSAILLFCITCVCLSH